MRERENGMKNTFFRDYSPPLLAPQPFRPPERTDGGGGALKGQMRGGRDGGGGRDDGWTHIVMNGGKDFPQSGQTE